VERQQPLRGRHVQAGFPGDNIRRRLVVRPAAAAAAAVIHRGREGRREMVRTQKEKKTSRRKKNPPANPTNQKHTYPPPVRSIFCRAEGCCPFFVPIALFYA